MDNMQG
jgi:hypothetical protein